MLTLYKELNILEDQSLLLRINAFSIILLIVTGLAVLAGSVIVSGAWVWSVTIFSFLWGLLIFLFSLPVHEWIHGLFFKYFSDHKQVTYGFTKGMLYATNPGVVYTKRQFLIIALAPFVLNSLFFYLLSYMGIDPEVLWIVFILHTSGCAGDFWYVYELIKQRAITHCEDTKTGIKLYIDKY